MSGSGGGATRVGGESVQENSTGSVASSDWRVEAAPVSIRLEPHEFLLSALIGAQNQLARYTTQLNHHASIDVTHETEGYQHSARSELAMSKWLDSYYDGHVTDKSAKDVAGAYQLRSTALPQGRLILRDIDSSTDPFVLAIIDGLEVRLMGWIWGESAKTEKYRHDYRNCVLYWVPQQDLEPMSCLPSPEEVIHA